jgi:hypothetical protein
MQQPPHQQQVIKVNSNTSSGINLVIREFNPDMLEPHTVKSKEGGTKIIVIGKPKSGKSTAIKSLLHAKRHIFPCAMVMSGTEETNGFYQTFIPSSFIYNDYDEDKLADFIKRQKLAKAHLANQWSVLIIDDCTDKPSVLTRPIQQNLWKNGRHYDCFYILSLQYAMDARPFIRNGVDCVFIFREPNIKNRKSLYDNYGGIVPEFSLFCQLLDNLTGDYGCLVIYNQGTSNVWTDCVYYWRATIPPVDWKLGSDDFWKFHDKRYNQEYVENPLV